MIDQARLGLASQGQSGQVEARRGRRVTASLGKAWRGSAGRSRPGPKAGEAWRREQAAQLIRSVRIIYAKTRKGPKDVRAYTAVRGEQSHQANYMPTEEALADDFTRQLILRDMKREWHAFKRRYDHMAEFADLILADLNKEAS